MLTISRQHKPAFARLAGPPPGHLSHIDRTIRESASLLDLTDEEGRPLVSRQTWERAVGFLARTARAIWNNYRVRIDAPDILPTGDGSVDLHWDKPAYELLINFPADPAQPGNFFGDDRGASWTKGTIGPDDMEGYLPWLTKRK